MSNLTQRSIDILQPQLSSLTHDMFKPQLVNGRWHKPQISAMKASKLRKIALMNNQQWLYGNNNKQYKYAETVTFKGHVRELDQEKQRLRVIEGLASQPQKLKEYYETQQDSRLRQNDLLSALTKGKHTLYKVIRKEHNLELKPQKPGSKYTKEYHQVRLQHLKPPNAPTQVNNTTNTTTKQTITQSQKKK